MRYNVIFADPPWPFRVWSKATGHGRSAESHYPTMTWADLRGLGPWINFVAAPDCALLVWATRPSQHTAIEMVACDWNLPMRLKRDRWIYKTEAFTWIKRTKDGRKPSMGLGYYSRANSEPVLLFTRGNVRRVARNVSQVVETFGRMPHSVKPDEAYTRTERLFAGPYLELFGRKDRPGWDVLGNGIDGLDIRTALRQTALTERLKAS